jgi:hypothetical protein
MVAMSLLQVGDVRFKVRCRHATLGGPVIGELGQLKRAGSSLSVAFRLGVQRRQLRTVEVCNLCRETVASFVLPPLVQDAARQGCQCVNVERAEVSRKAKQERRFGTL